MSSPNLDVRYVANLARLDLTAAETADFQSQLTDVLAYIAALEQVDVSGIDLAVHAEDTLPATRPDLPRPSLAPAVALADAPASKDGLFLTPRIVE